MFAGQEGPQSCWCRLETLHVFVFGLFCIVVPSAGVGIVSLAELVSEG